MLSDSSSILLLFLTSGVDRVSTLGVCSEPVSIFISTLWVHSDPVLDSVSTLWVSSDPVSNSVSTPGVGAEDVPTRLPVVSGDNLSTDTSRISLLHSCLPFLIFMCH